MTDINLWAILAAAIASMIIGSIWYGPLFGKQFMVATGMDKWTPERQEAEKKNMGKLYGIQFAASLLMFFVLTWLMTNLGQLSLTGGLTAGFWSWLGFVMPVQLANQLWGGKMTLFWIGTGNMLLTLLAAGAIIGSWA